MRQQVDAIDVRPGDTIPYVGRVMTVVLNSNEVQLLFCPLALPPGTRLAPDMPVWVER